MILVTGAAGFIGSNFVRYWREKSEEPLLLVDSLAYAGNAENLEGLSTQEGVSELIVADIGDKAKISDLLKKHMPRAVINFAAETHVDRSIMQPDRFMQANVVSLFELLESVRKYWADLDSKNRTSFRFVQISTDEVYGSLELSDPPFDENSRYAPNSPYSASKAAGDHFVRAYYHTYGLPTLITNCSNNYGPYQFPEKLIPLCIIKALELKPLPIYGDGLQIRDWLHVNDHCDALVRVLEQGVPGEVYNVGGNCEMENINLVRLICRILDDLSPRADKESYAELITFVEDRAGHDRRYAVDNQKIGRMLNWKPSRTIDVGLRETVDWYLQNQGWTEKVCGPAYKDWLAFQYGGKS